MSRDNLRTLEELQAIDLRIRELTAAAEEHPARLKKLKAELAALKAKVDGDRGKLADNERGRREHELRLGTEKDKVRKWESRLNELKTPREYAALARELDIAKKSNQTSEAEIQRLSNEHTDLKNRLTEGEQKYAAMEQEVAAAAGTVEVELGEVKGKLAELEKERQAAVAKIERSVLGRYERVRQQKGGLAVVPVVGGTCKGCQMSIPPQMANNLRSGAELQTCPSCHRFIYAADPVPPPEA